MLTPFISYTLMGYILSTSPDRTPYTSGLYYSTPSQPLLIASWEARASAVHSSQTPGSLVLPPGQYL